MWFLRWSDSCLSFLWVVLVTGDKGWHIPAEGWAVTWQSIWNPWEEEKVVPTGAANSIFDASCSPFANALSVISVEECPEWVHWIKSHHRTEITGRVHQGKITVQLYLLSVSATGFYFPQLEREPPVSTADVRELPRDTGLLESTWYCIYLLLRPYLAQIGFQICALLWSSLSSESEMPSHVTMPLWIKK